MRKLFCLATVSMLSILMTLPSPAMEERHKQGDIQNIDRRKVYEEALSSLQKYIEVINEPPYRFQEVKTEGKSYTTPQWRSLVSRIFNEKNLRRIYGDNIPRALVIFGDFHERYKDRFGEMTDMGETISLDSYPDVDYSLSKEYKETKNEAEAIHSKMIGILFDKDSFSPEEVDQIQECRKLLFGLALTGNSSAQAYLYQGYFLSKLGHEPRSNNLTQGQQILFRALNHLLKYPVT